MPPRCAAFPPLLLLLLLAADVRPARAGSRFVVNEETGTIEYRGPAAGAQPGAGSLHKPLGKGLPCHDGSEPPDGICKTAEDAHIVAVSDSVPLQPSAESFLGCVGAPGAQDAAWTPPIGVKLFPEPALAVLFDRFGGVDAALQLLTEQARTDPGDPMPWSDLGNAFRVKGDTTRAIHCFEAALELRPHGRGSSSARADTFLNLGGVKFLLGHLEEAVRLYHTGLSENPKHVLLHFSLGNAYAAMGRADLATEEFERALVLQPDFAAAQQYLRGLRDPQVPPDAPTVLLRGAALALVLAASLWAFGPASLWPWSDFRPVRRVVPPRGGTHHVRSGRSR